MGIFVRITARTCKLEKCCNASHNGTKHFVPYKCYSFFSGFCSRREGKGDFEPKGTSSFLCEKEITISFLAFTTQSCFLGTKGLRINAPTYEHNVVIRLHVHWLHFPLVVLLMGIYCATLCIDTCTQA